MLTIRRKNRKKKRRNLALPSFFPSLSFSFSTHSRAIVCPIDTCALGPYRKKDGEEKQKNKKKG